MVAQVLYEDPVDGSHLPLPKGERMQVAEKTEGSVFRFEDLLSGPFFRFRLLAFAPISGLSLVIRPFFASMSCSPYALSVRLGLLVMPGEPCRA